MFLLQEAVHLVVKVDGSFLGLLVALGHVQSQIVDDFTHLLKLHQFQLVLLPHKLRTARVVGCI